MKLRMLNAARILLLLNVIAYTLLCGLVGAIIDRIYVNHKLDNAVVHLQTAKDH